MDYALSSPNVIQIQVNPARGDGSGWNKGKVKTGRRERGVPWQLKKKRNVAEERKKKTLRNILKRNGDLIKRKKNVFIYHIHLIHFFVFNVINIIWIATQISSGNRLLKSKPTC